MLTGSNVCDVVSATPSAMRRQGKGMNFNGKICKAAY
jgi:hypothetical protein